MGDLFKMGANTDFLYCKMVQIPEQCDKLLGVQVIFAIFFLTSGLEPTSGMPGNKALHPGKLTCLEDDFPF